MSESSNSAYATLGITKAASDKEIKQAYVNMVKKYDPEKHTERFMIIQRAFDRLKTPQARAKEDVYSLNALNGEYLFQPEERYTGDDAPGEEALNTARASYKSDALKEDNKKILIRLLFHHAHYALRRKQLNPAIEYWNEVLEAEPSHIRARRNLELACAGLGYSYALHGLFDDALDLWERALKMNPDNTELVQNLALIAEKGGLHQKAGKYWAETVERWKQLLAKDPENDYLRQSIIEAITHHGEYVEEHEREIKAAEARANKGSAPPPQPSAPSRPAVAQPSSASVPKAPAAQQAPGGSSAAVPRPSAPGVPRPSSPGVPRPAAPQAAAPKSGGSVDRYREILKLKPDDFDVHFQLCNKLMEEQLYDDAQKELMLLARKHPKNVELLNLLGWALLNSGQRDMAFNAWKKSLSLDPHNSETREQLVRAHLAVGKAFRGKGMFTQALVHFKQLMQLMPESAEVHLEIAATYDMKGDVRSAAHEYNRVLTIDPKNKVARKALNDLRMKR